MIRLSLAIASSCSFGLIWRNEVRTRCKVFEPHLALVAILVFLLDCNCGIVQEEQPARSQISKTHHGQANRDPLTPRRFFPSEVYP